MKLGFLRVVRKDTLRKVAGKMSPHITLITSSSLERENRIQGLDVTLSTRPTIANSGARHIHNSCPQGSM